VHLEVLGKLKSFLCIECFIEGRRRMGVEIILHQADFGYIRIVLGNPEKKLRIIFVDFT